MPAKSKWGKSLDWFRINPTCYECIRFVKFYVYPKTDLVGKIKVGIVDDHPGVRFEIRKLLANDDSIVIVGEGSTGADAIVLVNLTKPDVLLLDVELPVMRGNEVVNRLRETAPEVKVLAISSYDDPMFINSMLENGAVGYIIKDEAPRSLIKAIHSIMSDQVKWITTRVADKVSRISLENKIFTGRELEILRYLKLGQTDQEICRELDIDERLVGRHLALLMRKFNVTSRKDLIDAAQGVISTPSSPAAEASQN